jgi:hypothetical protein
LGWWSAQALGLTVLPSILARADEVHRVRVANR